MSKEQIKKVFDKVVESNGKKAVSKAMKEVGYPETTAKNPQQITRSKTWDKLLNDKLSDTKLTDVHGQLLNATRLDSMTFPPEHAPEAEEEFDEENLDEVSEKKRVKQKKKAKVESVSDKEIKEMLASVNCVVKRIVHTEFQRIVYFWSADNKARKEALDMAYKLKNKYPSNPRPGTIVPIQINFGEDREKYG
jgi:hypothetical protein